MEAQLATWESASEEQQRHDAVAGATATIAFASDWQCAVDADDPHFQQALLEALPDLAPAEAVVCLRACARLGWEPQDAVGPALHALLLRVLPQAAPAQVADCLGAWHGLGGGLDGELAAAAEAAVQRSAPDMHCQALQRTLAAFDQASGWRCRLGGGAVHALRQGLLRMLPSMAPLAVHGCLVDWSWLAGGSALGDGPELIKVAEAALLRVLPALSPQQACAVSEAADAAGWGWGEHAAAQLAERATMEVRCHPGAVPASHVGQPFGRPQAQIFQRCISQQPGLQLALQQILFHCSLQRWVLTWLCPRPKQERDWRRLEALFSQRYSLDPCAPPLPGDPPLVGRSRGLGRQQSCSSVRQPVCRGGRRRGGCAGFELPARARMSLGLALGSASPGLVGAIGDARAFLVQVCAVKEGDMARLHALLYFGSSVDASEGSGEPGVDAADAHGATALVHAASRGDVPAARLLLAHGAAADWQASSLALVCKPCSQECILRSRCVCICRQLRSTAGPLGLRCLSCMRLCILRLPCPAARRDDLGTPRWAWQPSMAMPAWCAYCWAAAAGPTQTCAPTTAAPRSWPLCLGAAAAASWCACWRRRVLTWRRAATRCAPRWGWRWRAAGAAAALLRRCCERAPAPRRCRRTSCCACVTSCQPWMGEGVF